MRFIFLRAAVAADSIALVIPAGQQGSGNWSLYVQPEAGQVNGPTMCNSTGFSGPAGCTMSQTDTVGDLAAGQVLGYTDGAGIHILTSVSTAGDAQATGMASDTFYDEVTNNLPTTAEFSLTFQVDATITSNFNGASLLGIEVGSSNPACFAAALCAYEYNVLQTWNYREANDNSTSLNQEFVTDSFTLGAGQSTVYVLYMSAESVAFNGGTAATLAQNTLSITGFTATDMYGNPLPASDFTSGDGANYSTIDTSAVPEPAALLLAGSGLILVGLRRRRKSSES